MKDTTTPCCETFSARGPFKEYGKQAFTPEVPPQVLRGGRLVPTATEDGVNSLLRATCRALDGRRRPDANLIFDGTVNGNRFTLRDGD